MADGDLFLFGEAPDRHRQHRIPVTSRRPFAGGGGFFVWHGRSLRGVGALKVKVRDKGANGIVGLARQPGGVDRGYLVCGHADCRSPMCTGFPRCARTEQR